MPAPATSRSGVAHGPVEDYCHIRYFRREARVGRGLEGSGGTFWRRSAMAKEFAATVGMA